MYGQGIEPEAWHPLADRMPAAELREMLANIQRIVSGAVEQLPAHADHIARCCAAPAAAE